jgi:hypothetical protein
VELEKDGNPPNSSAIKELITSNFSTSIVYSSTQELYRRRALVIAFGSVVPFGGDEYRRSTRHVIDQITLCVTYRR